MRPGARSSGPFFFCVVTGGSAWESNPASPRERGAADFEDREGHRTPFASGGQQLPGDDGKDLCRQFSERTFPARGPFAEGSSSNVTR
jgi:hypothetical protein